jgi:hypothetical protein
MTLSDKDIEKELSSLKPLAPENAVRSRIDQNLLQPEAGKPEKIVRIWPFIVLASAACLALVFVLTIKDNSFKAETSSALTPTNTIHSSNVAAFANFEPVEAEKRLLQATDEGIFLSADNEPLRRLRYQFVDTVTMVNQVDGSVFKMEIHREEILFIPVTLL